MLGIWDADVMKISVTRDRGQFMQKVYKCIKTNTHICSTLLCPPVISKVVPGTYYMLNTHVLFKRMNKCGKVQIVQVGRSTGYLIEDTRTKGNPQCQISRHTGETLDRCDVREHPDLICILGAPIVCV